MRWEEDENFYQTCKSWRLFEIKMKLVVVLLCLRTLNKIEPEKLREESYRFLLSNHCVTLSSFNLVFCKVLFIVASPSCSQIIKISELTKCKLFNISISLSFWNIIDHHTYLYGRFSLNSTFISSPPLLLTRNLIDSVDV